MLEDLEKRTELTLEEKRELDEELSYRKGTKRAEIAEALKEARAQGDLSENAEYDAARAAESENTFGSMWC